jgi:hypothetical protein
MSPVALDFAASGGVQDNVQDNVIISGSAAPGVVSSSVPEATSKKVMPECLETLEDVEEQGNEEVLVQPVQEQHQKKRAHKAAEPIDVRSLCHSTHLNKDLEDFKT